MTGRDETEAAGDTSGALERRSAQEVAPQQTGAVATAGEDERAPARPDDAYVPVPAGDGRGTADDPERAATGGGRRRLRRSLIVLVAIAVAATAGIAATGALGGDGGGTSSAAPTAPPATAKVERTTLTDTQTVDGNLGYGSATTVQAPVGQSAAQSTGSGGQQAQGGSGSGIVTWLPDEGKVIKRGDAVYRVNEQKVPLLYGSFPLYRTLRTGSEGADVRMLEKNLRALGYTGFTVDDEYTSDTADAVRKWQDDLGRDTTGTAAPGDAVVASGSRRVAAQKTALGAALSGAVLSWTDTERIVSVDLDVSYEDLVDEGTKATVKLPDNTVVEAEVTDIGTPASTADDSGSGGSGSGTGEAQSGGSGSGADATLPVELTVKNPKSLGRYQAAAVDVTLKAESRKNVLAVPVFALMARQGGGYALEVITGKGTELRPVELGMFASGKVEVSGSGIEEGTVVGVPK
ncbi:peptidoglycan-binding protein [Streptomyces sp. NPDC001508]|uniref:peptidoglycan-binding protein n=1 Tax=Streptomyces sp. NPDC001508 TaxID=3154656 RepID=UPI003318F8CD